jgi:thiol:disulfide interchange protein
MVHRLALFVSLAAAVLVAACGAPGSAKVGPLYSVEAYDPGRDPSVDLAATLVRAGEENKRVILEIGGEWCVWCEYLDAYIKDTPTFRDRLNRDFIVMKVNFSKENENADFLANYPPAEGYPFLIILGSDGSLVGKQNTGELEAGRGYDDKKMMAFLKTWST